MLVFDPALVYTIFVWSSRFSSLSLARSSDRVSGAPSGSGACTTSGGRN
jgi:hypothetical protein